MPDNSPPLSFNNQGSTATPVYMGTTVKVYPVTEEQLENISAFSKAAAVSFSFGALFIPAAIESFKAHGMGEAIVDMPVAITIVCYVLGIYFWWKRGSTLDKIRRNCVVQSMGVTPTSG